VTFADLSPALPFLIAGLLISGAFLGGKLPPVVRARFELVLAVVAPLIAGWFAYGAVVAAMATGLWLKAALLLSLLIVVVYVSARRLRAEYRARGAS
jgi:uncharacterized membrane protein YczE